MGITWVDVWPALRTAHGTWSVLCQWRSGSALIGGGAGGSPTEADCV